MNIDGIDFIFRTIASGHVTRSAVGRPLHISSGNHKRRGVPLRARARAVNVCVIWQFLVKESISSLLMIIQMEFLHGLPKEKKSYYAMGFKNVLIVYF